MAAIVVMRNRTETHDAGAVDRFLRRQSLLLTDMQGEIDQHDAVLLDDADQEDDADDRDHAEIEMSCHQQHQCSQPRRRQRRDDGDGVDQALIQYAEDEVDHEQRCQDQDRRGRQRVPEGLRIALEAGRQRDRLAKLFLDLLNGAYGLPDSDPRPQVERDCH